MAWASRVNPVWDAWFNRVFAPLWVHVVMHAALYAVLIFGAGWLFGPRLGWGGLVLILLTVAGLQEGLQVWGAGRLPGWGEAFDLLVDAGGALAGWFALQYFHQRQLVLKRGKK